MFKYFHQQELKWLIYSLLICLLIIAQIYIFDAAVYILIGLLLAITCDLVSVILHYRHLQQIDQHFANLQTTMTSDHYLNLPDSQSIEQEIIRRNILKITNEYKTAYNELAKEQSEYQEYLELWIHETKIIASNLKLLTHDQEQSELNLELEHLEDNIQRVIALSSSANLNLNANIKLIDLTNIIYPALKQQRNSLTFKQVKVNLNLPSNIQITTDEYWLSFVVKQLINNSIKYGAKIITIDYDQSRKCLSISDDGLGISPNETKLVFQKYYCSKRTKNNTKSTGIGLYIVKRICDQLGLKIILIPKSPGLSAQIYFK